MRFAVQLYSLRDMAAKEGGEAALRLVSETGYEGVEFAGFYGYSPRELAALLKKYSLKGVCAHLSAEEIENALPYISALDLKSVVIPYLPLEEFDDPKRYADRLGKIEKAHSLLQKEGVTLGYHNHAHEFEGGKDRMKKLLDDLPFLRAEPDVFWLHVAGFNAQKYLRKLGERAELVHIKEAAAEDPARSAEPFVGEGVVGMEGVFSAMREIGAKWAILEAEQFACSAEEYLRRSFINMQKLAEQVR